jgi:hypothetical protein
MKVPAVSLEVWRGLYENALRFMKLQPWESAYDSDVFGVLDPVTGLTGYCCIMGALGQVLALCVYRGSEGLKICRRMHAGDFTQDFDEVAAAQFCLMGEFEDRSALKKQDLAIIKALGLKCRGRQAYPVFRSYLPGYCPWFLTDEEARYLALAFDAAIQFIELFRAQPDILSGGGAGSYLVYQLRSGVDLPQSWTTSWRAPDPLPRAPILHEPMPEDLLREILSKKLIRTAAWEVGSFIMPNARITEGDRPYYARILLAVHSQLEIVLASHTIPSFEDGCAALRDLILSAIRDHQVLPQEIRVCDATLAEVLKPISSRLGITTSLHRKLPAVLAVKQSMAEYRGIGTDTGNQ